jgi:hypothetical protein
MPRVMFCLRYFLFGMRSAFGEVNIGLPAVAIPGNGHSGGRKQVWSKLI